MTRRLRVPSTGTPEAPRAERCEHPVGFRRSLGLDKEWRSTGTYCQQCGTVLERRRYS